MCRTTPSADDGCVSSAWCRHSLVHCGHSATRSAVPSASEPPLPKIEPTASDYCPYDLSTDPAEFGLVAEHVNTAFGQQLVLRRPHRVGDEATLLLHGVGARWTTWTPLLRAAGGTTDAIRPSGSAEPEFMDDVVLVDLPGFGKSENLLGHLRSLDVAAELGSVLTQLGYRRAPPLRPPPGGLAALHIA